MCGVEHTVSIGCVTLSLFFVPIRWGGTAVHRIFVEWRSPVGGKYNLPVFVVLSVMDTPPPTPSPGDEWWRPSNPTIT